MTNALIVGSDRAALLNHLPDKFLFIDDGELIDRLDMPRAKRFDPSQHSFNPLKDMTYRKALAFVSVIDAAFPEGENTLTNRYSRFQLLEALLQKPRRLDGLIKDTKDTRDAYIKVQRLLLSPVLERVLNRPTNFSFKGTILAKLDPAILGDFDCFVLAAFLAIQYEGPVVISDFGSYACGLHIPLIREGRLVAQLNSFDEVPRLRNLLITIEEKVGSRCTPKDAELLATYEGIPPGTNEYNDFIQACIHRGFDKP